MISIPLPLFLRRSERTTVGPRSVIPFAFVGAFLLAFATPRLFALDDHNPIGVTGAFEGITTTGCAYNVLNHNATRQIDDIVVPGSIGKYPLKMTRYYNSRRTPGYGALGAGWSHDYSWAFLLSVGKIQYPNGNVQDSQCEAPLAVSDAWETGSPVCDQNGCRGDFRLADGGTLHLDNTNTYFQVRTIKDPYGQTTTFTYNNSGSLTRVTEPGGRYLQFNYYQVNGFTMLSGVDAYDGRGNRIDWVVYHYTSISPGGQYGPNVNCLTSVDYSDGQHAYYTYQQDNAPDHPGPPCPCIIKVTPLLQTAQDVRYKGAMRQICYEYQAGGPHGAIIAERYSLNGSTNGPRVSWIDPPAPSPLLQGVTFPTTYTETRGDSPTRTFNYTPLSLGRPPNEEACPSVSGPAPQQFLQSYTDFQGHTTALGYDANWYVNSVTDANNHTTFYTRGPPPTAYPGPRGIGQILTITHPGGSHVDYVYEDESPNISGHYVHSVSNELQKTTTYTRNPNTHLVTRIDYPQDTNTPASYEEFTYNPFGEVLTHHLKNGAWESFAYDGRGLLTDKYDPNATVPGGNDPHTHYDYYTGADGKPGWIDRVKMMTLPRNVSGFSASETYEYDRAFDGNGITNLNGAVVAGRGLVTKITHADGKYQRFKYDWYGNKRWEDNELRNITQYTYDDYNRLLSVTNPLNKTMRYDYAPTEGNTTQWKQHTTNSPYWVTTPTQIKTHDVYDQNWRKISTTAAYGTLNLTTTFDYDDVGNPTMVTDPLNHTTTTDYDTRNRKWHVWDAQGHQTTFTYDGASNVISILRPDTYTETKAYDAMNRLISHTVPKSLGVNLTTWFAYNSSGTIQKVTDARGSGPGDPNYTTTFEYNAADEKTKMTYPDGSFQSWAYDDAHNLASRTTVHGETQSFTYDIRNRKVGMTWSNNADSATYGYDDVGRLTSAANPNSTVTRQYDDAGRLTLDQQNVNGLGTVPVNYGYDDDGKENHLWVPGATPSYDYTYGYDAMGRFETIRPTSGSVAFQYYYDAASNETRRHNYLSNPQLDQFYNRDELNRIWRLEVKKGTTPLGREDYGYDVMNRLGSVTREDNKQDQFGYYRDGELNWVLYGTSPTPTPSPPPSPTPPPGGTPTPTPPGGQVAEPRFSPGGGNICPYYTIMVTISTTTSGAQIRYTLDGGAHWTTIANPGSVTFQPGPGKTLTAIGFKSGMTDSNPHSEDYERDCGQGPGGDPNKEETTVDDLLSLPEGMEPESLQTANRTVTYFYDKAGNRTTVTDDVNGNTTYTPNNLNQYTAVTGSTITNGPEHEIAWYGNTNYTYLNDEHLIEVTSTTQSTGNNDYQLRYDALGRCVKRTVNGVIKYYIYDGEKAILEYKAANALLGRNVYGKGIDEILMRTDYSFSPALTFYYQQDHEGSVTYLTSTSGNVLEKYRYDVYGAPTIYPPLPGATPIPVSDYSNRFMFTGRDYSNMFGFYEYRARAYHAGLGRFMSEDPKLFDAGDYNLFRYCHNDPIDMTDPMGTTDTAPTNSPRQESLEREEHLSASQALWQRQMTFSSSYGAIAAGLRAFHVDQSPIQSFLKLRAWVQQYRNTPMGKLLDQGIEAVAMTEGGSFKVANPVPTMLARAVPGTRRLLTLGRPSDKEVFVAAASDLKGVQASQLGKRLGTPNSDTWTIIRFPTPATGLASPVFRNNPGFVPGGLTSGGAREFVIRNGPIPPNATIEIIGGGH